MKPSIHLPKTDQTNIEFTQLINNKMNNDLKLRYSKILLKEHNIKREGVLTISSPSIYSKVKLLFIIGASIILLTGILGFAKVSTLNEKKVIDSKELIFAYMEENKVEYSNNFRSQGNESISQKVKAYMAFEKEQFATTVDLLDSLKDKNTEDLFFMGVSQIKLKDYQSAAKTLNKCLSILNSGDDYFHEAKLYLMVSFILNDQKNLADSLFQDLDKNSWEYGQLQHIMNGLS